MEDTLNVKSIVLSRQDFRENDVLVFFFSKEKGVFSLVARGAKKKTSKLAGHIEPFNLVDLMVIKGRQYDYIGSVRNIDSFLNIKNDLDKIYLVFRFLKIIKKLVKEDGGDDNTFLLLSESLSFLNKKNKVNLDFFDNIFILKLFSSLGFGVELDSCVSCSNKIIPNNNFISINQGGLICQNCVQLKNNLTISNDCIKMLKLAKDIKISRISKIQISSRAEEEFAKIVSSFEKYYSY